MMNVSDILVDGNIFMRPSLGSFVAGVSLYVERSK
jgi:hypothetical protein